MAAKQRFSWFPQKLRLIDRREASDKPQSVTWIYGDSFVNADPQHFTWFWKWATTQSPWVVNASEPGSGPERAVWLWYRDHSSQRHRAQDRVLIAASEISRQFQDNLADVNWATGLMGDTDDPQRQSIQGFYQHMAQHQRAIWGIRMQSLMMWLDRELARSPADSTVVHSFSAYQGHEQYDHSRDLDKNRLYHWFQNAGNMWPCLSYWSVTDPGYRGDIANDDRQAHLSLAQHWELWARIQTQTTKDWILETPPKSGPPLFRA